MLDVPPTPSQTMADGLRNQQHILIAYVVSPKLSQVVNCISFSDTKSTLTGEAASKDSDRIQTQDGKGLAAHSKHAQQACSLRIAFHLLLPIEIVVMVIGRSTTGMDPKVILDRFMDLSSVCSFWNGIIKSTPHFWATIHSHYSLPLIKKALSYSKAVPLDITYMPHGRAARVAEGTFISVIIPQLPRCRSLTLTVEQKDSLDSVMQQPAPLVEQVDLVLSSGVGRGDPVCGSFFRGTADRIRELRITGVDILLSSLSTLRELEIINPQNSSLLGSELLATLKNNPALEQVKVHGLPPEDTASGPGNGSPIHLRHLKTLILSSIPSHVSRCLFSNVHLEDCEYFSFSGSLPPENSNFAGSISGALNIVRSVLLPANERNWTVLFRFYKGNWFECAVGRRAAATMHHGIDRTCTYDALVRCPNNHSRNAFPSIETISQQLCNLSITVELEEDPEDAQFWMDHLEVLPRLIELYIPASSLRWLGPYLGSSRANGRTCPNLRKIWISGWSSGHLPRLVKMVEARYGAVRQDSRSKMDSEPLLTIRSTAFGSPVIMEVMERDDSIPCAPFPQDALRQLSAGDRK